MIQFSIFLINTNMLNFHKFFEEEKLSDFIDGLIFFFKKDNIIYGATEESRLIFAQIKNPEKDDIISDINFSAYNLNKLAKGKEEESVFSKKDAEKIKIITKEQAIKALK